MTFLEMGKGSGSTSTCCGIGVLDSTWRACSPCRPGAPCPGHVLDAGLGHPAATSHPKVEGTAKSPFSDCVWPRIRSSTSPKGFGIGSCVCLGHSCAFHRLLPIPKVLSPHPSLSYSLLAERQPG